MTACYLRASPVARLLYHHHSQKPTFLRCAIGQSGFICEAPWEGAAGKALASCCLIFSSFLRADCCILSERVLVETLLCCGIARMDSAQYNKIPTSDLVRLAEAQGLDYDKLWTMDLLRLAEALGLVQRMTHIPRGQRPTHLELIAKLKSGNPNGMYGFLDLPPEVRNRIYGHLLNTGNLRTCSLGILAVSRQINSEASGVFYGYNTFKVRVYRDRIEVDNIGTYAGSSLDLGNMTNFPWPSVLQKAKKISLILQDPLHHWETELGSSDPFVNTTNRQRLLWLNWVLYSLCTFLEQTKQVRFMELRFHNLWMIHVMETNGLERNVLYPLRMLSSHCRFTGTPVEGSERALRHLKGMPSTTSALRRWEKTLKKARICQELARLVGPEANLDDEPKCACLRTMFRCKGDLMLALLDICFLDESWEPRFNDIMQGIEARLAFTSVDALRSEIEGLKDLLDALKRRALRLADKLKSV